MSPIEAVKAKLGELDGILQHSKRINQRELTRHIEVIIKSYENELRILTVRNEKKSL